MTDLILDKRKLVDLCRQGKEDLVIAEILNNKELNNYISSLVGNNSPDDKSTVLHDTTLNFIRSCMKKEFKLDKQPLAYIKTIAKNVWYMQLRKKRVKKISIDEHEIEIKQEESYFVNYEIKEITDKILANISEDCQQVLLLWAKKYRMQEIASEMEYASEKYAKKKKHLCLKKLIAFVEQNPHLKEELKLYV